MLRERGRGARGLRAGALAQPRRSLSSLALLADGCSSTWCQASCQPERASTKNRRNQGPEKIVGPGFRPSTIFPGLGHYDPHSHTWAGM